MANADSHALSSLQAGRGLAAAAVAAFHLSLLMAEPHYAGVPVMSGLTAHGNLGVDFFFVLSGFIILHAHHRDIGQPQALGRYAWRRFARLFPVYWLYAGAFTLLVLTGAGSGASPLPSTLGEVLTGATLVRLADRILPLPVAWSLVHELLFYVLFGLLIVRRSLGIAAFTLMALATLPWFHYNGEGTPTPLQVYTAACNLYFLFGMAAWALYRQGGRGIRELAGGVVLFVLASVLVSLEIRHGMLLLVCAFMLLVAAAAKMESAGVIRAPRWLAFVGDASYSIYLLHIPVAGVLLKIVLKTGLMGVLGMRTTWALVLVGMILVPCLAYVLVERPLIRALRRPSGTAVTSAAASDRVAPTAATSGPA